MSMMLMTLLLLLAQQPQHSVPAKSSQDCPELDRVAYRPAEPDALANIVLERLPVSERAAAGTGAIRTPQGTAWLNLRRPDTTKSGPWTTVVEVAGNKARRLHLRLRLLDHASGGVRVRWLNEQLLWVQVWRGRIASTDLILDVDAQRFIYEQDANYNSLIVPCSMKIQKHQ
jgi:hypothetical protein